MLISQCFKMIANGRKVPTADLETIEFWSQDRLRRKAAPTSER